jgi:hypothetical protein
VKSQRVKLEFFLITKNLRIQGTAFMFRRILLALPFLCLPFLRAMNDEPDELSWENFSLNPNVFAHFRKYWAKQALPGASMENCPATFPAISLSPQDFKDNPGSWQIHQQEKMDFLQAHYGHGYTAARAKLCISEPGTYRVWVKYYKHKGYFASFALSILPSELLRYQDQVVTSSQGQYYSYNFDWKEHSPKRPTPLPVNPGERNEFIWESGDLVDLSPGEYAIELSTLVHGGPFTFRKIAKIVLCADPLLENPESISENGEYPACDPTKQAWNAWNQRPGSLPWEALSEAQRNYYLEWRRQFLQKLCENPEGIAEQRLAAKVYFDEQVNLIGTPQEVADEKKAMASLLEVPHPDFAEFIEAEDMQISKGWEIKDMSDASGKILMAGYADGLAEANSNLELPKAGTYYVWVRYHLYHKYFNIFDLSFSDSEGKTLAKLNYGQPEDRFSRRDNLFTWECHPAELPAGKLLLLLRKNVGKGPYTYRRVDKIFITDTSALHPDTFWAPLSDKPLTLWQSRDPWDGFVRSSAPQADDIIEPSSVSLVIPEGDAASLLFHLRNDGRETISLTPRVSGTASVQIRLVAYLNTALYKWTPAILLERQRIFLPPHQNTSLWITIPTQGTLAQGQHSAKIELGERNVDFKIQVIPATPKRPVPIVGGWCKPLQRSSCWELFRDIGVNLIFNTVVSQEEMQQYGIKHFALSVPHQEENMVKQVALLKNLGLKTEDWSYIMVDEPTKGNVDKWLSLAQTLRKVAPEVQIWCNPGEIQSSTADVVRQMREYIDVFCPYINHFNAGVSKDQEYREKELPEIGKVKLLYTTPCFNEKAPNSPKEILSLGQNATKYSRDGWSLFSLFCSYTYSNSIWDEMHPYDSCQAVSYYPGAYGRTLSTRNMEAVREAIQRYRQ